MKPFARLVTVQFELAIRIYVFLMISLYGLGKIAGGQFHRRGHLTETLAQTPLSEVGSFDLAWTFFGYSNAYILFIGLSQLIGGFMLLFERTKLIGVAALIPILLNIIVVDVCYAISPGALLSATTYLLLTLLIVWFNREKVIAALQALTRSPDQSAVSSRPSLVAFAIVGLIIASVFLIETSLVKLAGY